MEGAALDGRGLGGVLGRMLPPEGAEPREGDWALGAGREGALEGRETLDPPPEPPEGRGEGAGELGRGLGEPWEPREEEPDDWEPFEEPR